MRGVWSVSIIFTHSIKSFDEKTKFQQAFLDH